MLRDSDCCLGSAGEMWYYVFDVLNADKQIRSSYFPKYDRELRIFKPDSTIKQNQAQGSKHGSPTTSPEMRTEAKIMCKGNRERGHAVIAK